MKSGQLTTKGIHRIITTGRELSDDVDSSNVSSFNDKKNKYLSDIYDDTFKCIKNSDIQEFNIHRNVNKRNIFVSLSNSNIELYNKYEHISSLNYINYNNQKYHNYYIISKGIGCFQIYY